MFSSFIIQSGIAIIALLALVWLGSNPQTHANTRNTHTESFVTALVTFHKSQCYFASTIQIAALILSYDSFSATKGILSGKDASFRDFVDTSVLIVLATSGLIPIVTTLVCITRYGRQTWYILVLSSITYCLASATLVASFRFAQHYGEPADFYGSEATDLWFSSPSCTIDGEIGDSLYALCGSSELNNNALQSSTVTAFWIWLVWLNCTTWLVLCVGKKIVDNRRRSLSHPTDIAILTRWRTSPLFKAFSRFHPGILVLLITSALCFGSQFSLFSIYLRHYYISPTWTFGQIIAVTVWIPSVFEYLYIEYSTCQSPTNPHFLPIY